MITIFQAIILGLLQGISELFPISSLGHSVIFPRLVGWQIDQNTPFFLIFLVATHLATAIVLLLFFWRDWVRIFKGMGLSLRLRVIGKDNLYGRLGWLLVAGTIPAGILGLLLQEKLQLLFAAPKLAALFLAGNGLMLYAGELLRRKAPVNGKKNPDAHLGRLSFRQSVIIGTAQVIALIPGFSRSGSTIVGGLLAGLSHEDAARFSFLLATPIIGAAAVLKIPELLTTVNVSGIFTAIAGALAAAVAAYFSVKFLMKYFHTEKLTPFAAYCLSAGAVFYLVLIFRH